MTKMRVTVKARRTVKPSAPTWTGTMPLSDCDQTGTLSHVGTISFYKPHSTNIDVIIEKLRVSLSQTLVHFYPLAGRLRWISASRLVLDCNEMGVLFIEAVSDGKLQDFGDFSPSREFHDLTPSIDYVNVPINLIPPLLIQVTSFKCGGICVSISISHAVADGSSVMHFSSEWARATRGKPVAMPPFLDRKVLIHAASENYKPILQFDPSTFSLLPILIGKEDNEEEKKKETITMMLTLTKSQVEKLKKMANEGKKSAATLSDRPYTRYETLTAHIWKCACKAHEHAYDQQTGLGITVDFRTRMNPPLPQTYFGNAVLNVIARARSGELMSNPLGYASGKIREAIDTVTHEYICSMLSFFKTQKDLSKFQQHALEGSKFPNPNFAVTSWLVLPPRGILDFGWGQEICMRPTTTHDHDDTTVIYPDFDKPDGSLIVAMSFQAEHIEKFKKFFYEDIIE